MYMFESSLTTFILYCQLQNRLLYITHPGLVIQYRSILIHS